MSSSVYTIVVLYSYYTNNILCLCTRESVFVWYSSSKKILQIRSLYRREIVFSTQGRENPLLYTEDDILHLCAEKRACLFSTQRMTYSISVQRRECASIVLVYQEYITTIVYTKDGSLFLCSGERLRSLHGVESVLFFIQRMTYMTSSV